MNFGRIENEGRRTALTPKELQKGSAKYVGKAVCIAILIFAMVSFFPVEKFTSDSTATVLNFLGISAATYVKNGDIYLEGHYITIKCTAMRIIAVCLGLVLSTKSCIAKKLVFSVMFSVIIFLMNVVRLSIGYCLSEKGLPFFVTHDVVWWSFFTVAVIFVFIVSRHYLPQVNENVYTLSYAGLNFLRYNVGRFSFHH